MKPPSDSIKYKNKKNPKASPNRVKFETHRGVFTFEKEPLSEEDDEELLSYEKGSFGSFADDERDALEGVSDEEKEQVSTSDPLIKGIISTEFLEEEEESNNLRSPSSNDQTSKKVKMSPISPPKNLIHPPPSLVPGSINSPYPSSSTPTHPSYFAQSIPYNPYPTPLPSSSSSLFANSMEEWKLRNVSPTPVNSSSFFQLGGPSSLPFSNNNMNKTPSPVHFVPSTVTHSSPLSVPASFWNQGMTNDSRSTQFSSPADISDVNSPVYHPSSYNSIGSDYNIHYRNARMYPFGNLSFLQSS